MYSLHVGSTGWPKKTTPLKNFNNFVPAGYFFFKINTLVEEVPRHIPAKFYEKIFNIAKVMASQRKKFKFSTQPA